MEALLLQLEKFLYFITLNPASFSEFVLRLVLGFLACTGMLVACARALRMSFPSYRAAFIVCFLSGLAMLLLASLAQIYFKPAVLFEHVSADHFAYGVFTLVSVFVIIPFIRSIWCGSYLSAAVCWICSIALFILTCAVIDEIMHYGKETRVTAKQQILGDKVQDLFESNELE